MRLYFTVLIKESILWSNNDKTLCQFKKLVPGLCKRGLLHCLSIERKFLNNHIQTSFFLSFPFYFGFNYTRGDSGARTSFISASLLRKSIHSIIFHFNAHLMFFSSRIHNSLPRRRAYQRENKHKQQRPSLATHHRSLLSVLCYHLFFSLSCLSSWVGRVHLAIKTGGFVYWEKHFYIRESCDFSPTFINQSPSVQQWCKGCLKQYSGGHIICRKFLLEMTS